MHFLQRLCSQFVLWPQYYANFFQSLSLKTYNHWECLRVGHSQRRRRRRNTDDNTACKSSRQQRKGPLKGRHLRSQRWWPMAGVALAFDHSPKFNTKTTTHHHHHNQLMTPSIWQRWVWINYLYCPRIFEQLFNWNHRKRLLPLKASFSYFPMKFRLQPEHALETLIYFW